MQTQLKKEMDALLQNESEKMKRKFSDPRADDPLSIMKSLSEKDPVIILETVFNSFLSYLNPQDAEQLRYFIQWVMNDGCIRRLFLLSIYKGAYSVDKLFPNIFEGALSQNTGVKHFGSPQQKQTISEGMHEILT